MPIPSHDLTGDLSQALKAMGEQLSSSLRVAVPGIIQSFDPETVTCTVQPAVNGSVPDETGAESAEGLTLLVDLPVTFQRGGGVTLTFPIKAGDECLVIFSDRCIDFWYQSGGIGDAVDQRQHDTSDAFVIVGPQSQAQKVSGISTNSAQMRSDDGSTYFELNPTTQTINIVAPGGFNVTSPLSTFSAAVTIKGLLTWMAGMVGSTASGIAAKITGAINFIGTLTSNDKDISDQHTHGGVQTGSGNTNKVN